VCVDERISNILVTKHLHNVEDVSRLVVLRCRLFDIYARKLPQIAGVWVWVLDGLSLPVSEGGHGGARGEAKTFAEKMNELLQLATYVQRLIVVTAMNIHSFVEYYGYLYGILKQAKAPLNEVTAQNFWIWGRLFAPVAGYVFIHNDVDELKRTVHGHIGHQTAKQRLAKNQTRKALRVCSPPLAGFVGLLLLLLLLALLDHV
jgi:hypothetical protein